MSVSDHICDCYRYYVDDNEVTNELCKTTNIWGNEQVSYYTPSNRKYGVMVHYRRCRRKAIKRINARGLSHISGTFWGDNKYLCGEHLDIYTQRIEARIKEIDRIIYRNTLSRNDYQKVLDSLA